MFEFDKNKKILIIGAKGFSKADCIEWDNESLRVLNIPDYDLVILNINTLTTIIGGGTDSYIRDCLVTLLKTDGTLLTIGKQKSRVRVLYSPGGNVINTIDNYFWLPLPLTIYNESGTSRNFSKDTFKEYFNNVKEWSYCFDFSPEQKQNVRIDIEDHVWNRYNKFLAGRIYCYSPSFKSGDFYFLPCPTEITDIEAINFILEKLFNVFQKTPPPEWTKYIEVPGLSKIQEEIKTNLQKIEKIAKKTDDLKDKESELISYRELLYETGTTLEEIVREVFTSIGYEPKPPKYKEEYILEFRNRIGVIECKGNEKSIKRSDFRQLLDYTKEYELDGEANPKGILIGNAWRLKALEERGKSRTPLFPKGKDGVQEIAIKHDIALVSTIDLFKVFCMFLEEKIKGNKIMEKIFNTRGIVSFDN